MSIGAFFECQIERQLSEFGTVAIEKKGTVVHGLKCMLKNPTACSLERGHGDAPSRRHLSCHFATVSLSFAADLSLKSKVQIYSAFAFPLLYAVLTRETHSRLANPAQQRTPGLFCPQLLGSLL